MNIKVFVIHYKKLIERKKNIIEQFKKNNIENYEFIDIDRSEILIYDLSIFEKNWLNICSYFERSKNLISVINSLP